MAEDMINCPAYRAIDLLQEKWVLHIIRTLLTGPKGFNELSREVGGCNPATLAQRLEHLEAMGLVSKTVQSVMPPKTSYRLSPSGRALTEVVEAIDRWARRYLKDPLSARRREPMFARKAPR
jgi:DNA-binding HxlR family transcriptional regulator